MKTQLSSNLPKISIVLISAFFISTILMFVVPTLGNIVLLYPSNLHEPLNWYRLVTYPLFAGGLSTWIHNSLVIFITALIIENRLKTRSLISLIVLSTIIGGLVFILINQGEPYDIPIGSPTMITWGYLSAAIIIGLRNWQTLNRFEKIVMILCFLSILSIRYNNFGFLIGQLSVMFTIALLTMLKLLSTR